jgi:hypothetical protein
MKKITTAFLMFLMFFLASAGSKQGATGKQNQATAPWETLETTDYSIHYPADWEVDKSGQMGTTFIIFSPLESDTDKFKENVNLLEQNLAGKNIDLDQYTKITEEQVKTLLNNSTLLESKRVKKGNKEYQHFIYNADQGILHIRFEQYCWLLNDTAYILTFTCEQSKIEDYKATAEKILNSFTFKK